jgi:hypothetical protein
MRPMMLRVNQLRTKSATGLISISVSMTRHLQSHEDGNCSGEIRFDQASK